MTNIRPWLGLALALSGCGIVAFNRPVTEQEVLLRGQVRAFFGQLQEAFAAGNPQALSVLFSPSITRPMTHDQLEDWSRKFFAQNKTARFRILKMDIEQIGPVQAVVLVSYKVETPGGAGDFGATDRDTLAQNGGRWSIIAWEKVHP